MFGSFWKSMDCIIEPTDGKGGLYLGNINSAEDIPNLQKFNIKAVLTAAAGTNLRYQKSDISDHKIIPAEDIESYNLSVYFKDGVEFIEKNLQQTNVLVHCFAGVSRSSTMVIAYLMKNKKMNYAKVLAEVRGKRSCVYPNNGFAKQLIAYEKSLNL